MSDRQTRIADDGSIEDQPRTWDGEPLWSVETVQEGLFASEAFEQMPGQIAMSTDEFADAVLDQLRSNGHDGAAQYFAAILRMGGKL